MRTEMDVLVLGNHVLHKSEQMPLTDDSEWRTEFALD
jgi:carbamoyltransferase